MSNLSNSTPSVLASCLAVSVFPHPVGPKNKKLPTGLFKLLRPALATKILSVIVLIASSCPNTCSFIFSSNVFKLVACFCDSCSIEIPVTLLTSCIISS